jgi:hypothetical protein
MPKSPATPSSAVAMVLLLALLLAAGLALAATPDPLPPNGGFEDGAAGWTATAGELVIVTEPVRTGSRAGRLAANGQGLVAFLESGFVTVTAGAPYTLTGAVYYTDTTVAWTQLRITWYSDTTSTALPILPQSTPILAPAAGWQAFSPLVATPPAGAHAAKVRAVAGLAALNPAGPGSVDANSDLHAVSQRLRNLNSDGKGDSDADGLAVPDAHGFPRALHHRPAR